MNSRHHTYKEKILTLVEPIVEAEHMELVDVECLKMKSRWLVRLYIDKEGGVTIDDCADISHQIGDVLDVYDIPPGPYNLEVSSPGLNRPLVKDKHFLAYRGARVKIRMYNVFEGKRNFRGTLVDFIDIDHAKTLVVEDEGIRYYIPRELVAKANLEYEL
jgi:ribosome maturation factor RimP